jgi:capsular exopolysaccharide synthesis family protein
MSRFYDALKQAGQLGRDSNASSAEELWQPFGVESVRISHAPEAVAGPTGSNGPPPVPTDVWSVGRDESSEADTAVVSIDSSGFGTHAKITLDQKARVIPNVADHAIVEYYRRLRTKLIQQHSVKPFRSVVITSANPQEGKTVTTLNLALSFAMLPSFRVLVVDGDLRRGTLGKWLGIETGPGLSNLIEGTASLSDVVLRCEEIPIHFIVHGNSTTPPAELLHSRQLSRQFQDMTAHFDLVLVDSPPVNLITDTQLLASYCDAVIVIARAFVTRSRAFEKMVQDLSPHRILGTVLNGGTRVNSYGQYGGYY